MAWEVPFKVKHKIALNMKPITIDLNDYEIAGGGKLGDSYIKRDNPDILLKIYPPLREQMGRDEFERAWKVYRMGLPCPEPGQLVRTTQGLLGVQFTRIHGKKSFARALSEHPEQLDKYASEFAQMCLKLHSTTPPSGLFPTAKEQYIHGIINDPFLTDREKNGLERYITKLPDAQTAVHGDLHHGNMIFTDDGKKYYIDLSEFCTGIPWFDIGIIYRQTVQVSPEMEMELYHIDKTLSTAFWNAFVRYYFGTGVNAKDIEQEAIPYANLRILCLERLLGKPSLYVRPDIHKMIGL